MTLDIGIHISSVSRSLGEHPQCVAVSACVRVRLPRLQRIRTAPPVSFGDLCDITPQAAFGRGRWKCRCPALPSTALRAAEPYAHRRLSPWLRCASSWRKPAAQRHLGLALRSRSAQLHPVASVQLSVAALQSPGLACQCRWTACLWLMAQNLRGRQRRLLLLNVRR